MLQLDVHFYHSTKNTPLSKSPTLSMLINPVVGANLPMFPRLIPGQPSSSHLMVSLSSWLSSQSFWSHSCLFLFLTRYIHSSIRKSCLLYLKNIFRMPPLVTSSTDTLGQAFVISHLEYGNGIPASWCSYGSPCPPRVESQIISLLWSNPRMSSHFRVTSQVC